VPTELVDGAIDHVKQKIFALGEREIDSRLIGEMVMKELLRLDKVAYIRFASVYKSFQDVGDFTEAIAAVGKKRPHRRKTDKS
jgi:transcriptional repressor NrdR